MEPAQPSPAVAVRASAALDERQRVFLDEPRYASLATVDPDGAPRQAVIWYRLEDDGSILVNSRAGRRWPANLERDGRAGFSIIDPADGNRWIGLTGRVASIDHDLERARDDIVALARFYEPEGPTPASIATFRSQKRISFRIAIDGVHDHLED